MKKILIITILLFCVFALNAQDKTLTPNFFRAAGDYYTSFTNNDYNFGEGDTIITSNSYDLRINLPYSYPVKLETKFVIDSVSGDPTMDVFFQERMFTSDTWTPIDTISWAGTSTDTTIIFTYTTNALYAKQVRYYFVPDATTQKSILTEGRTEIFDK